MLTKFGIAPVLRELSATALARAFRLGEIGLQSGIIVPRLSGADPVTEALDHVAEQLKAMNAARASGESVDENKARELEETKRSIEQRLSGGGGNGSSGPQRRDGESDNEFYRRFHEEITERAAARSMVEDVLGVAVSAEAQKAERMKGYAVDAVKEVLGGGADVTAAVERVLKQHRPGSRFLGSGADRDFVENFGGRDLGDADLLEMDGDQFDTRGMDSGFEQNYRGRGFALNDNGGSTRVTGDREIKMLQKTAAPKDKGGEGLGMGQFIVLLNKHKFGVPSDAERRFYEHQRRKALAEGTQTAGGVLVPREYMQDLLGVLRAQAVVRRAQPRIQRFSKEMYQTSVSTGATAFYTQENAQIPISEETFAEAPLLTPKNLTALVPVSNYLLNDADAAEEFVRADLAEVMALREDLAFLRGTGSLGEPRGFRNIAGITLDPITPGAGGVQLTLAQLRRIRAVFRSQNAGAVRPTWFFNPEFLTYLETREEMSGGSPTGRTLIDAEILTYDDDTMTSGRFDGVRFYSTTQLPNGTTGGNPTTELYLVNMAETIVGENQELEIDVSREASYWDGSAWVSAFQNNQSVFRAVMRHDIAHRRPAQIVVQTGSRTT